MGECDVRLPSALMFIFFNKIDEYKYIDIVRIDMSSTVRERILSYYLKDKYREGLYSTKNPRSVYEILCLVVDDGHNKYIRSTFCKEKHEELMKKQYMYSFHCLETSEMERFIREIEQM